MCQPPPNFAACLLAKLSRRSSLRGKRRSAAVGFTIIELCVVLLIMGILAAAAAPTFYSSLQYHELETAARRVVLDLKLARDAARVQSEPQSLTFTNGTSYTLSAGVPGLNSSDDAYIVDLAGHPYGLDAVTLNLGGDTSVSFDGYGNTTATGTVTLSRGGQTRTITLNGATGAITYSNP